jgi:P22 coat protein - gene protein 5
MVTNTLLTIDDITYEALRVLKGSLAIGNRCIREFDNSFGVEGAKIGNQLRIRIPARVTSTVGPALAAQNSTETYVSLPAQTQRQISFSYLSSDLSLSLDNFSARFIKPAMVKMASDVDQDGVSAATQGWSVANSTTFGGQYGGNFPGFASLATPGGIAFGGSPVAWAGNVLGSTANTVASASQPFMDAASRLTEQDAPQDDMRYCVLSPAAKAVTVPQLFVNFNPQAQISEMFQKGVFGELGGLTFFESINIPTFTSGTWSNAGAGANVKTASSNGDTSIVLQNVGNSAVIVQGDQFTISGVQALSPVNYSPTGFLQVFTVLTAVNANATGVVTVSVFPALQPNGQYAVVSAGAAQGANVKFMGTSNTTTQTNFAYHREGIALAVAPLAENLPGAEVSTVRAPDDGLGIRYVEQYQALTDQTARRFDILYGWAVVRPTLGCLIRS